jgi:predicted permease
MSANPFQRVRRLVDVGPRIDRDVNAEIQFHLDSRTEELIMSGLSPDEARRQAEQEYGSVALSRRELSFVDRRRLRRNRLARTWHAIREDLWLGARTIWLRPAFSAVVILTLALGIGGNAVMFGVVDRLLLRGPAHVDDADRLVRLYTAGGSADATPSHGTTFPLVTSLVDEVGAFEQAGGYFQSTYTLGRGVDAIAPEVMLATGNYFRMLGVRSARGRFFTEAEDVEGEASRVLVLAWGFWQRQFGGEEGIIGRQVVLDNKMFTVIGVAPGGFNGVDLRRVDLWVPVHALAADNFGSRWKTGAYAYWIKPIAKLKPGVQRATADAEATLVAQRAIKGWSVRRDTLTRIVTGSIGAAGLPGALSVETRVSVALIGVTAVVLLIACANVANLLLARTMQRRREIATRLALGAGGRRLVGQQFTETLVLCFFGVMGGLVIAVVGGDLVRSVLLPDVGWADSPVDRRVTLVAIAAGLVTCVMAGLAPALHAGRTDPAALLRADARSGGGRTRSIRNLLVVTQAALSIVLMVGAALFVRSLHAVRDVDTGLEPQRTWLVSIDLRRAGFDDGRARQLHAAALSRVSTIPGVERVAPAAGSVPFRGGNAISIRRADQSESPPFRSGPWVSAIDTGHFATLGATILEGREFTADEVRTAAPVTIVNEALATTLWPSGGAVGSCVHLLNRTDCTRVVGVVENIMFFGVLADRVPMVYVSTGHPRGRELGLDGVFLRVSGRGAPAINHVRREVQALAPGMPFVAVRSYAELMADDLRPWVLGATMFTTFGVLALVMAAIGLYSVLAYLVAQRRHELGVRMALGARPGQVLLIVLRDGFRMTALGIAVGVVLTTALSRHVESLLFGVSARDPVALLVATVVFLGVGAIASLVPGMRAARVDPALPLRANG